MEKSNNNLSGMSSSTRTSTPELSGQKYNTRGSTRKRKRSTSESSTDIDDILPGNAFEVEKNLQASAIKNNLDHTSVKKILKKVVTNDHVLALVKLKEEEEKGVDKVSQYTKLTRSRARELMKIAPQSTPWNLENLELTPIKHIPVKTRPEVEALIAHDLPDDEDDDEYQPTAEDLPSDDDQTLETCSDVESMPRTPATPAAPAAPATPRRPTPPPPDGPFKVPTELTTPVRRKLQLEEETIALRTRSKINLSSTSIEHIESAFVPPDELPLPAVDDVWSEFLLQCLGPAPSARPEDDDDDPEYNVAADPDAHEDEEALDSSIVNAKVSRKELNDLITELLGVMPECMGGASPALGESAQGDPAPRKPTQATHWEGKKEPVSDEDAPATETETTDRRLSFSVGKTEPEDDEKEEDYVETTNTAAVPDMTNENREIDSAGRGASASGSSPLRVCVDQVVSLMRPVVRVARPPPLLRRLVPRDADLIVERPVQLLPEQVQILQQQLRQHIQLCASNFLQLFVHPVHWSYAPAYKEYLESLKKLRDANPNSLVDVCNLTPALELVASWESTVSVNNKENMEMIKFVQKEIDRAKRRAAGNVLYVGDFHETFKQVVATSPVFLYPYLLPATPYRVDRLRKSSYSRSEDCLIATGLDQFWDYVEANPDLFKPPRVNHPRYRWGLTHVAQLMCKHMFPWLTMKLLITHIHFARQKGSDDNPIKKFFKDREVVPVQHKLLPFNPDLTLYEQPEHEMPRLWVRHLAKTSKRFKSFYYKRKQGPLAGKPPGNGILIDMGKNIEAPKKVPLPTHFTKEIKCHRSDLIVNAPQPADRLDVVIGPAPAPTASVYTLVNTSTGPVLVPLLPPEDSDTQPSDCNANIGNLDTTTLKFTNVASISSLGQSQNSKIDTANNKKDKTDLENVVKDMKPDSDHCKCCILLRKICKEKQTLITDYFTKKRTRKCSCDKKNYPTISNKLRLLVNLYKGPSKTTWLLMQQKIKSLSKEIQIGDHKTESKWLPKFSVEDLAAVISFQTRLAVRTGIARNNYIKKRIYTLLSKFDPQGKNPLVLADDIFKAFGVELVDMYQEFVGFLTPQQALETGHFKEYFVHHCAPGLLAKIEEQVKDKKQLFSLLTQLSRVPAARTASACELCCALLEHMRGLPDLARYTAALFPHSTARRINEEVKGPIPRNGTKMNDTHHAKTDSENNRTTEDANKENMEVTEINGNADDVRNVDLGQNDGRHARSSEVGTNCTTIAAQSRGTNGYQMSEAGLELNTPTLTITKTEVQFADVQVKPEDEEWTRDEDKLILEVLKDTLTPEERKDKTIVEILVDKNVFELIAQGLEHKSVSEIKSRVLYLLRLLVQSEK